MSGFERKAIIKMREWCGYGNHKALLVRGMRQVGKTFLIKRFAESDYKSFIYVNLEREKSVREIFETGDRTFESIVERLQFETRVKLYGGRSAIILDEIQFCPEAFSSLKALAEPGIYDIIASGSLLGILLGSGDDGEGLSPVGYVNILDMYPMDFEEWLWARGFEKRHTE